MITDKLLDLVAEFVYALVNAFNSVMPSPNPPDWLDDAGGVLHMLFEAGSSLGAWVPIAFGLTVVKTVIAVKVAGFGIKVIRILASFLTAGGGAAG